MPSKVTARPAKAANATRRAAASPVAFVVEVADAHAHLYRVTLRIARPAAVQRLSLPVWIPGSYLVREFARHLQGFEARQAGRVRKWTQVDKCSWEVQADSTQPLEVTYLVYALDNSVRTAWLDASRGFFNGTSLCLRVEGQEQQPHTLEVPRPAGLPRWQLATGLRPAKVLPAHGFGLYRAADYDELADSPVEMGAFWSGSFTACGVRHRVVVAGAAPSFDGARLLADSRRICETAIRFWHAAPGSSTLAHKPPQQDYVFMLNVVDDGYGGLEHRNSTALICARKDLPRLATAKAAAPVRPPEGYTTLLGLISHEYFHTWNVKRLRPAEFARYDYTQENYTRLLWFFEGFTSYYDDLLLRRAGLLDDAAYLKLLTKSLNQVLQTPGRKVHSVAQASFEAWTKYYRQDENTPNITVSYYTKGAAVGLCLDLSLRAAGGSTLDAVMRGLWQRCGAGPMCEQDLLDELQALTGRDWTPEIRAWVHGTAELPLQALLEQRGVAVLEEPAQPAQALGLRVAEGNAVQVKVVLRDGPAQRAGMAAGDEWLGVEVPAKARQAPSAWRLQRLEDLALFTVPGTEVVALVARDRRLLRLPLRLPAASQTWRLAVRDAAKVTAWLGA